MGTLVTESNHQKRFSVGSLSDFIDRYQPPPLPIDVQTNIPITTMATIRTATSSNTNGNCRHTKTTAIDIDDAATLDAFDKIDVC